jgi:AcrR family transcriptional regulator
MATSETRERILDAAERLFASQGFAATSLRTVITDAGVNLAAIHYHFGSKEALIRAVFARRLEPLNAERLRRLDLLEAGGGPVSMEDLLETFIRPAVVLAEEQIEGIPLITLMLSRMHTEPGHDLRSLVYEQFEHVSKRFIDAFGKNLPGLPLEELYTRFHFVIGTMASSFADPQRLDFLSSGRVDRHDVEALITRMIVFLSAAMRAPAADVRPRETPRATAERSRPTSAPARARHADSRRKEAP